MKIMTKGNIRTAATVGALSLGLLLVACGGDKPASQAQACRNGLDKAYAEMKAAEAAGFRGSVDLVAAAGLLAAAETQEKFSKYPNCIDKVQRARQRIRQARQG